MHREFVSSYAAKFVIMKDRMYTENANRALKEGLITPDNLEPNPKNPLIASFFEISAEQIVWDRGYEIYLSTVNFIQDKIRNFWKETFSGR